jgi:hypothetical protein
MLSLQQSSRKCMPKARRRSNPRPRRSDRLLGERALLSFQHWAGPISREVTSCWPNDPETIMGSGWGSLPVLGYQVKRAASCCPQLRGAGLS